MVSPPTKFGSTPHLPRTETTVISFLRWKETGRKVVKKKTRKVPALHCSIPLTGCYPSPHYRLFSSPFFLLPFPLGGGGWSGRVGGECREDHLFTGIPIVTPERRKKKNNFYVKYRQKRCFKLCNSAIMETYFNCHLC